MADAIPDQVTDAGCVHLQPPDPPDVQDAGGDVVFVVAAYSLDFGDAPGSDPLQIGYDLDMRCTCQGQGNSCLREEWATRDACDGPGGRDNMAGMFVAELATFFPAMGSAELSEGALAGAWSLLLKVSGYNGEPDDDRVRVDWYIPAQFCIYQDGGTDPPKWDGSDAWPIRTTSLVPPQDGGAWDVNKPMYYDDRAYVTDGTLVMSVSKAAIQINEDYALSFTGGVVTARVEEKEGAWVLEDGIVAARWPLGNVFSQIGRMKDPVFDMYFCTSNPVYPQVKKQVCDFVDIYSGVGTPTTPCDAISVGLRFSTAPAALGPLVETGPVEVVCDPEEDPANDSCGTP